MAIGSLDVCTGCGPGAMKGPYRGDIGIQTAITDGVIFGITGPDHRRRASQPHREPTVIMPESRKAPGILCRFGPRIVFFPGGEGTAEEILYLLGILLDPANEKLPFPWCSQVRADSADYFQQIHHFIGATLGAAAQARYRVIIDDPAGVARAMVQGMSEAARLPPPGERSYGFNWLLKIPWSSSVVRVTACLDARTAPVRSLSPGARARREPCPAFRDCRRQHKEYGVNDSKRYGPFELPGAGHQ